MGKSLTWPDEINPWLVQKVAEKLFASEIVEDLRREFGLVKTRNAVISRLRRLGLGTRPQYGRTDKRGRWVDNMKDPTAVKASPPIVPRAVPPEEVAPAPLNLTIMELTPATCRWPVNEDRHNYLFCGRPHVTGSPYCGYHERKSHPSRVA